MTESDTFYATAARIGEGIDATLRRVGLKATNPRRRILRLFENAGQRHLKAEEVFRSLDGQGDAISLATVYRVLAQFESAGLLARHHLEAGTSIFELSRRGDHNHLICIQCGMMTCFSDEALDRRQRVIAEKYGFELEGYSLHTYVNCKRGDDCPHKKVKRA